MYQSNTFDDEEEFPYTIAITYILSDHFLINPRRSDRGDKLMVLVFFQRLESRKELHFPGVKNESGKSE